MSGVEVRRATGTDAEAMARLLAALGYPARPDALPARLDAVRARDGDVLVATNSDGVVVGLLALHACPVFQAERPVGYITALVTAPEARGRGVGRALVRAAEAWARGRGCGRLAVTSAEHRADAHAFYPACGLAYTGRRFATVLADGRGTADPTVGAAAVPGVAVPGAERNAAGDVSASGGSV